MYNNKLVGVVILNYKDANTTIKLCNAIEKYNVIDNIVVVDNLSPDDSFSKLLKIRNSKINILYKQIKMVDILMEIIMALFIL